MFGHLDTSDDEIDPPLIAAMKQPIVRLALCWMLGITLGAFIAHLWLAASLAAFTVALASIQFLRKRLRATHCISLIAIVFLAAAWLIVQRDYTSPNNISQYISTDGAIVEVVGTVASQPRDVTPEKGDYGTFGYKNPGTLFEFDLEQIDIGNGRQPVNGSILIRIKQHDERLALGQRIHATGWLSDIEATRNPGEFDYREYLKKHGVSGRMTLMRRGNWQEIDPPPRYTLTGIRRRIGDTALASLHLGLPHDPQRTGLLDALLLGRRTSDIADLSESFRQVGLAHVLAISGAHLAILLLLVWWIGRLLIPRPALVSWLVFGVLIFFLLAVPWRTPIIRAAVMAAVFCLGHGLGRKLSGTELLAIAALIVLLFIPTDLFDAGFQLSFGVVAALLIFAKPVSNWIMPPPLVTVVHPTISQVVSRRAVDLLAVSLVAFMVSAPLAMYHFQLVSPLAMLLSMFALLPLTGLLGVGYLKILVGLVSPTASSALAMPLNVFADSLTSLVEQSQRLPGTGIALNAQPSAAWAIAALFTICAVFAGMFRTRLKRLRLVPMLLAFALISGWAWVEQHPTTHRIEPETAMTLTAFSVGDGSCFLIQSQHQTLMFDCGSQAFLQIGERSIVPALNALGVTQIDILFLSHADIDHYVGVLDVADRIDIKRILVSPNLVRDAEENPHGPTAFLIDSLADRGLFVEPIQAGWSLNGAELELETLWPQQDFADDRNNNQSLVLSIRAHNQRIILCGDIEDPAMAALLDSGIDVRADICDLPHHGSFDSRSPDWISAISPAVVLQSSGPKRSPLDPWHNILEDANITRLSTNDLGMIRVTLMPDGTMHWHTHRDEDRE